MGSSPREAERARTGEQVNLRPDGKSNRVVGDEVEEFTTVDLRHLGFMGFYDFGLLGTE